MKNNLMPFIEKFYQPDSFKIRYWMAGQGQPLLFLHGIGASTTTYNQTIELLSRKYLVIAPDLPGFGYSSMPPKAWGYQEYANFLNKFLESLNCKEVILVGHSFGGEIALRMAVTNPSIAKMVVIGATDNPTDKSVWGLIKIMLFQKPRTNLKVYKNKKQLFINKVDYTSNLFRKFFFIFRLARITLRSIHERWEIPKSISTPTLILWAKHDEVVSYDSLKKLLPHLTNSKLIEVNEYHDWPLFKPELLFEYL